MNTDPTHGTGTGAPQPNQFRIALAPAQRPILAWALVLMAAMLGYFVHLVNGQVERGARLHAAQRTAVAAAARRPPESKARPDATLAALP